MVNLSKEKRIDLIQKSKKIVEGLNDDITKYYVHELIYELMNNKYGLKWENHYEDVDFNLINKIPIFREIKEKEWISDAEDGFNFILEGDNLHSLKLLEKTHKNKIDVIYIDPPYNNGKKNWKYNNDYVDKKDGYRHSKWLSMMYHRLTIAKKLLTDEGVLICAIDKHEQPRLMLLLEEVFGRSYAIDCITIIHNPRGTQGDNFSYTHEYAIYVYKDGSKPIQPRLIDESEVEWRDLRDNGGESKRENAANCFYSINIKDNEIIGFGPNMTSDETFHPERNVENEDGSISIYPIDRQGIERKWRYSIDSVPDIVDRLRIKEINGIYDIQLGKNTGKYKTVWTDKEFDSNEYGTKLINQMVPTNDFDYPKSLYNTYKCLDLVVRNNSNAIILDFFAGSGTTGHAVALLNKNLGGNRKFILATNNEMGIKKEKSFKKEIGDINENLEEWSKWIEKYGIASSITYPRIKAVNDGFNHNKKYKEILYERNMNLTTFRKSSDILEVIDEIKGNFAEKYSEFKVDFSDDKVKLFGVYNSDKKVEGIPFNLKYYKTDFIDKSYDGSISSNLIDYIKELVQLQYHINIPNDTFKIIYSEEELDSMDINEIKKYKYFFIPSEVFLTSEQEFIFKNEDIIVINVPRNYYLDELRELREI